MYRKIQKYLNEWKLDNNHKVLLLRGARQVGKTFSVREFGKTFEHYVEVNFEEEPQLVTFFENSLNPENIIVKLSAFYKKSIVSGKTLLFFDEIQNCPNALKSLRFFYEKMPDLHVIAAGSLLEFALSEIGSFGVGRISSLFMYALSFDEFVCVSEGEALLNIVKTANPDNPIDAIFHNKLFELLRIYMLIGGMPAVVDNYLKNKDLRKCQVLLSNLVSSIQDDFVKYQKKIDANILREVFLSVFQQAGGKFKYSNISTDYKLYQYKNALSYITNAGLAYQVFHTSANGNPLGAEADYSKFKIVPYDIGIYQRMLGLNLSEMIVIQSDELINKGNLAEIYAGLQLLMCSQPYQKPELFYWHRESRSSNAEVDYVLSLHADIVPIEIKAGKRGQMQSMNLFIEEHNSKKGIRISHENFGRVSKVEIYPLYATGNLVDY